MITGSIVTFHTDRSELQRLIGCVMQSDIALLFIIDNSSNDELRDFVGCDPRIKYIHSLNLGYGAGHNIALRRAIEMGADYHAVLNPDIWWDGDVIGELARFMDSDPEVGQVMPKIVYPTGRTQYLCKLLPSPMDLIVRRFVPFEGYRRRRDDRYELRRSGYDKIMDVPSLSGCFMFLRCSVLKRVGLFDQRYFMYAEDLDLCRRIGEVSKTVFYPGVEVTHEYEKGSYKNKKLLNYHIRSIIKYFNKWGWFFDPKRKAKNRSCLREIGSAANN